MSNESTNDEQRKSDRERLRAHCMQLGEHFDNVQIFCSRHMPAELDGTVQIAWGSGNWFARYGQVREWVLYEEERIRQSAIPNRE